MTAGVYKIENKINHKVYIGCSKNIENRWYHHKFEAKKENNPQYNYSIHKAFRKYGINNFSFSILEEIEDEKYRFEREIFWINYYDSYKKGYNETFGGDSGPPLKGENNPHSKLTENDVINIRKRVCLLEPAWNIFQDYKYRISYSAFKKIIQGHTWKETYPQGIIIGKSEKYHKINKSEGSKRTWHPNKLIPPKKKSQYKVRCLTTEELFNSVSEAAETYNISKTALYNTLNGKTKTCGMDKKTKQRLRWKKEI